MALETFDATFYQIKKEAIDRYRRRWECLYSYNQHHQQLPQSDEADPSDSAAAVYTNPLLGKRVTLEDIPVAFDRIPNPFDRLVSSHYLAMFGAHITFSYGEDAQRYDWLTNASTLRSGLSTTTSPRPTTGSYVAKTPTSYSIAATAGGEMSPAAASGGGGGALAESGDVASLLNGPPKLLLPGSLAAAAVDPLDDVVDLTSTTHPFVHHQSIFFGKVRDNSPLLSYFEPIADYDCVCRSRCLSVFTRFFPPRSRTDLCSSRAV